MGLLALLFIARYCGVSKLQVLGDSEVIVKWFEGVQALNVISLDFWKRRIGSLKGDFDCIKACHIYREYNNVVDQLSKQLLDAEEKCLFWWT